MTAEQVDSVEVEAVDWVIQIITTTTMEMVAEEGSAEVAVARPVVPIVPDFGHPIYLQGAIRDREGSLQAMGGLEEITRALGTRTEEVEVEARVLEEPFLLRPEP